MKKSRFPDSLVLIFGMVVIAQILTYVLPAGEFERVTLENGREAVVPGTYETVEAAPLPIWSSLTLVIKGMTDAADIIFMVFIVGGAIGVIRATGAIDAVIGSALKHLGGAPILLVAGMVTLFSLGSSFIGMAEEYMPFIPILVTMCLALKMDAIVAVGIVYVGAGIGYGCAAYNPFTVVIGQEIAGIPVTSGQGYRWVLLVVFLAIGIHHVMRYSRRIQKDPSKSLVHDVDYTDGFEMPRDVTFSLPRTLVLLAFVASIGLFVWGASFRGWYLVELSAIFLAVTLVSAVIARLGPNKVAETFCRGATELTTTALLIGFARTIQVVLQEGTIIDTVINGIAGPLNSLGPELASVGMFAVQSVCNFFIPSGSGQAYVTMPIMAPLADLVGVTRQTAVLAYTFGDGFTNMIVPTNALLMGMLALGRIPFQRWARFIMPLLLKLFVAGALALMIAVRMGYS